MCHKSDIVNGIRKIRIAANCTEFCIPVVFSSLLHQSDINVCKNIHDHICAWHDTLYYIHDQNQLCKKRRGIEKNFNGLTNFRADFPNFDPEVITEERKIRTLLYVFWEFYSNITTISEEKLIYGSKDLLAWLGGALGIFVGYSFYDFAKHIIDITFYFIYRMIHH